MNYHEREKCMVEIINDLIFFYLFKMAMLSQNKIFFINPDKSRLFIKKGVPFKHKLIKKVLNESPKNIEGIEYNVYRFVFVKHKKYDWDCLRFAESIARDDGTIEFGDTPAYFKEEVTGLPIGETDKINLKIAKTVVAAKNTRASPKANQLYIIMRKKANKNGEYPYHAACVIAVDGKTRITIESFADTGADPGFMMYGDNYPSFHTTYGVFFENKNGTVVASTVVGVRR